MQDIEDVKAKRIKKVIGGAKRIKKVIGGAKQNPLRNNKSESAFIRGIIKTQDEINKQITNRNKNN